MTEIILTGKDNPKLSHVRQLIASAAYRKETMETVLDGHRFVKELLRKKPDLIQFVLLSESLSAVALDTVALCQKTGRPYFIVSDRLFAAHAVSKHPDGCVAVVKRPVCDGGAVLKKFYTVAVLDQIQNPENVGAIIRSAAAFGIDGVCYITGTADPYHPEALRAAAGTTFIMKIFLFDQIALDAFSDAAVYVMDAQGKLGIDSIKKSNQQVIVLGSETKGVCSEVLEPLLKIAQRVCIPISTQVDSLNVAVAAGVVFYRMKFF